MFLSLSLAFLAGLLSILSPCVLPLVPIVLGTALSQHRLGPVVLAAGLALSFVAIGLFVALFGFAIGLDSGFFRAVGAVMLFAVGVLMVAPDLSTKLAAAAGPVGNWAEQQFGGFSTVGLWGQFGVGLLLGMVWSSLRRPDAWGCLRPGRAGQGLGAGRWHDGDVRHRERRAVASFGSPVSSTGTALARRLGPDQFHAEDSARGSSADVVRLDPAGVRSGDRGRFSDRRAAVADRFDHSILVNRESIRHLLRKSGRRTRIRRRGPGEGWRVASLHLRPARKRGRPSCRD